MNLRFRPILIGLLSFATFAHADIVPMNRKQLQHALQAGEPCCIIDGRSEANRKKHPIDALPYTPGLQIKPTADVVVVADDDQTARKIATQLDAAYPGKRFLAVLGGVETLEGAQMDASRVAASSAPAAAGISFVIPKNTCESGSPLQQLRSGKK
ncbi:MAG: hypothetical protein ACK4Q4_03350 [Rhodocyclaceae bacterium]